MGRKTRAYCILALFLALVACQPKTSEEPTKQEILDHGKTIRDAFLEEDIDKLTALHHPDVIKMMGYNNIQRGREEVVKGLKETFSLYSLEFVKNEVESILLTEEIAIEQTKFTIRVTPKKEGAPFSFHGRTQVTYIRSKDSPTNWATIREIVQPLEP